MSRADRIFQRPADLIVGLLFWRLDRELRRIRNDAPH